MGIDMTDLEMVKRCAEKMEYTYNAQHQQIGLPVWLDRESRNGSGILSGEYDPLHDDAQAMALIRQFKIKLEFRQGNNWWVYITKTGWNKGPVSRIIAQSSWCADLNRAIVECVSRLPD